MSGKLTIRVQMTTYVAGKETVFQGGYITIGKGEIAETVEISPDVYADVDAKGNLLGIEFLEVPFEAKLLLKAGKKYHVPALKKPKRIPGLAAVVV